MRTLRIAAISLLALFTATAASDGTYRHCRRATTGRAYRSRTDLDHHGHAAIQSLEESLAVVSAGEVRAGGQSGLAAATLSPATAIRPVLEAFGSAALGAAVVSHDFLNRSSAPRGPPPARS